MSMSLEQLKTGANEAIWFLSKSRSSVKKQRQGRKTIFYYFRFNLKISRGEFLWCELKSKQRTIKIICVSFRTIHIILTVTKTNENNSNAIRISLFVKLETLRAEMQHKSSILSLLSIYPVMIVNGKYTFSHKYFIIYTEGY